MGFPAKLLAPGERLVLVLRPHVKVLLGPVLVLLVSVPVTALLAGIVPDGSMQTWMRLALIVVEVLILAKWAAWPFLEWWNTVYAITDRRLVQRQGVFNRSGHDMPLTRLNDVSFSHNVIERVLGCGRLVVESAGESGQLILRNIPHVEEVQRTLYRLSDASRGVGDSPGRVARDDDAGHPDELDPAIWGRAADDDDGAGDDNATKVLDPRRRGDQT